MQQFLEVLTSGDLDLWPFHLKIGTSLHPGERLYHVFVFELRDRTGHMDGQTDGRTDGQDAQ